MNYLRMQELFRLAPILILVWLVGAAPALAQTRTYTVDADFDEGALINVNHDTPNNDQLQLNAVGEAFEFIWVAASGRGTIVKIDTKTGQILGEYQSAPDASANDPHSRNPSRTTVDANGNVWSGNRNDNAGGKGSIVHIGLLENGQCVDRNGNGVIETSTGLGDVKPWLNPGGVDDAGGVSSAQDECIIHYTRTAGTGLRTVAIDGSNNVWAGGLNNRMHELIDGTTGAPVPGTQFNLGCGGYGGLVDSNGILWSATLNPTQLLRYDPVTSTGTCIPLPGGATSYGLGIDSNGNIWHSNYNFDTVTKISPAGAILGTFPTAGANGDRGVTVTPADDHVWVANSWGSEVSRLDNLGSVQAVIPVGSSPTGLAVDAAGKVWVTNLGSDDVMRIDPTTNAVDLTVALGPGAAPYNYSDMTGSTLTAPPAAGTWTVVYDSGIAGAEWGFVTWSAALPSNATLGITAASSTDGSTFSTPEAVMHGVDLTVPDGQYLKVVVSFTRASTGESPVLFDLTITANRPPDCANAYASPDEIWPPNHNMVDVDILGVTDPDDDPVTITVTGITQDEPLDTNGDGSFEPDGAGVGTSTAHVRAERSGTNKTPGNGRVYEIVFRADDDRGGRCTGAVQVCVPHDMRPGHACIDDGQIYDATGGVMPKATTSDALQAVEIDAYPNPFNPTTAFTVRLPEAAPVRLAVYDVLGRQVSALIDRVLPAGVHQATFDAAALPSGIYFYRLETSSTAFAGTLMLVK